MLGSLDRKVLSMKRAAYAGGTYNNIQTQWRTFLFFCLHFELPFLPTDAVTVHRFIAFLARSMSSAQSVRNYLNGVKTVHLCSGFNFEHLRSFDYSLIIKGLAREKLHLPKKALPVTPDLLLRIRNILDLESVDGASFWCACVLGFLLMLRKSNLVPESENKFDPVKHFCREDIAFNSVGIFIRIKWSKTNQCSDRLVSVPLLKNTGSALCPLWAVSNMFRIVPASPKDPAFLCSIKSKLKPFTHASFVKKFRSCIAELGLDPTQFSGHSFRRGGATWAFKCGVPRELLMLHGDWRSDSYLEYLDKDLSSRCSVSFKMLRDLNL